MIEAIESAARSNGVTLGYIGNSTVELINRLFRSRTGPDFFIEITGTEGALVFKQRDVPVYIRKFRSDSTDDLIAEIEKTVQFVRGHFSLHPAEYRIIALPGGYSGRGNQTGASRQRSDETANPDG